MRADKGAEGKERVSNRLFPEHGAHVRFNLTTWDHDLSSNQKTLNRMSPPGTPKVPILLSTSHDAEKWSSQQDVAR